MPPGEVDEILMKTVYILPTGDEILNGTVLDLDSPEIMAQSVAYAPGAKVIRMCPVSDEEDIILKRISEIMEDAPSLIVLIGGSGGGHRFSKTLGKDFTHTALERYLSAFAEHSIYGKNGHLWTRLLCGRKDDTVIINVPGPFVEAKAAFAAYLKGTEDGRSLDEISLMMAQAVYEKYPPGVAETV